ncbi:uncharacterized protein F5147DRAFT_748718 [Suillus discolor]|uniref:Retrovirus-related Pol polyprotein from transposon TNT 1-94-like beta-barrel domain-containing protein n=1 Tax=Suillus discolor TaxID=1912936 RepID=A0A9P7JLL7_9AGAM|nr:uncharacterized protein F5147DRAFT_748718 [Suillus discolor]KAG2085339.1 hypothetical protein F5147DRAFT_748718 [Suillus discolor]
MTPHHHYICNYTPKRMPIQLADSTMVYSAGVVSVVFNPMSVGEVKSLRAVEFTRVLHVPDLCNNLLLVLYLTRNCGFHVDISSSHMTFCRPKAGVRTLIDCNLVTGLRLDSRASPDPICEPCLAGKMHANPFPPSKWRVSRPLELIHTDVHQLPYRTQLLRWE